MLDREIAISARGASRPHTPARPANEPELDWQHIAIFAAGALLGAALGAGGALLFAPESGARTRHNIARRGRRLASRTGDAWDDLRHELRYAARRGKRKLHQALRSRRERRQLDDAMVVDD
jgi:hypothetical protein